MTTETRRKAAAWNRSRPWRKLSPAAGHAPAIRPGVPPRDRRLSAGRTAEPVGNDRRLSAYMARPGVGSRTAQWTVTHAGPSGAECYVTGPHGHWYPVTPAQYRRLSKHRRREQR
jgi:hypothetical protein